MSMSDANTERLRDAPPGGAVRSGRSGGERPVGGPAAESDGRPNRLGGNRSGRRRREGGRDNQVVPDVTFTSYYGRQVVRPSPWAADIPAYLFLGGLAAGSSLLGAGADLTGRPSLRRTGRLGAAAAITVSFGALIHDLGKPSRFVNMLRVAKHTSPMSVGTWLLTAYSPFAILGAAAEVAWILPLVPAPIRGLLSRLGRPAGIAAALIAPTVASYTAVLLSDTATPTWHAAHRQLPFVFVGSAAAAAGGLGLIGANAADSGPARRLAVGGAVLELLAEQVMEPRMGLAAEPLHQGVPGIVIRASKLLTASGALAALAGRNNRVAARVAGAALLAGSACTRFGIFYAGQASAKDPKYTVVPQRARINTGRSAGS